MQWTQMPLGAIQTNCYILENNKGEALIIDPGDEAGKLIKEIEDRQLKPLAVLLTHAHFDHIGALDPVRKKWDIPAYLHVKEQDWLANPEKNGSAHFPMVEDYVFDQAEELINKEGIMTIGPFEFEILETPGHSPGSISFYFKKDGVIFSGDALFNGSIGRTDLYGGDQGLLLDSIHSKLLPLPAETVVAPGHGFETTVTKEKETNPFLL
ncbi:glyoxylase-like metal-dependent hydrolase (beta-lactamase superfamily II) [Scopulibacillus darangshiensis]|uniref:Glyoxylase-like metal-dependent hydrolase (Beta-lactamase superfamily II) n=1 Tax=Scopulibacillus darangshiensis TaxID=442528 RepID=A0A4V2SNH8_9BACL|nr:MBL fold metallo-hydrolase [Scopulibacillus darangshiensis]TCP31146.1 glyoxylase-like metal-dependent hydrolase (beta-lactamase superfamily II) [Scopulibacillus darangshiensis]